MKSSTRRPTGLSANAVTIPVRNPKHRRSPRATLYSPPPSQTLKCLVLCIRPSPGSSRSITSPRLRLSHRHVSDLTTIGFIHLSLDRTLVSTEDSHTQRTV